jgi:hypothetical protein
MPPLDHATLQAVLDKQGMPNTTENLNRIAQFAAVAPDMLEKYLGRGTDQARVDAGGGTNAAIDRSIASTADPRLAMLAGPNPYTATLIKHGTEQHRSQSCVHLATCWWWVQWTCETSWHSQ